MAAYGDYDEWLRARRAEYQAQQNSAYYHRARQMGLSMQLHGKQSANYISTPWCQESWLLREFASSDNKKSFKQELQDEIDDWLKDALT